MPLQGVWFLLNLEPKALPWADMPWPFRPEHKQPWPFGRKTLRCPAVDKKLNSFSLIHQEWNSANPTNQAGH